MLKYGNAASEEKSPVELLMGQTENQIEYDRAGCVIKGQVSRIGTSPFVL